MSNVISTGSAAATRQFSFHVPGAVYTIKWRDCQIQRTSRYQQENLSCKTLL